MADKTKSQPSYNERLFSSGLRRWVHSARFCWLSDMLARLGHPTERVVELGCFDGKTIDYLPERPTLYCGYDADWEGGLTEGRARWKGQPHIQLNECHTPEQMHLPSVPFDTAICMETLEHVSEELVEPYMSRLAEVTQGYVFVTVPNEIGLVFLAKYLAKKCFFGQSYQYSLRELLNATLHRPHRVARHGHKGFDYREMIRTVERHFEIVDVSGMPMRGCPLSLAVTIGIVGKSRETESHQLVRRGAA